LKIIRNPCSVLYVDDDDDDDDDDDKIIIMYLSLPGFLYRPLWTFQLWPPDASEPTDASRTLASAPTDAFRSLAAGVGTYGRRMRTGNLA
jgi:hypothetical protein